MGLFQRTLQQKLNEFVGFLLFTAGLLWWLSLISYDATDPSWNTAGGSVPPSNLVGRIGALVADIALQGWGIVAFLVPVTLFLLSWKWIRGEVIESPAVRAGGLFLLVVSLGTGVALLPGWTLFDGAIPAGGIFGISLAHLAVDLFNPTGAAVLTGACLIVALYLSTSFSFAHITDLAIAYSGLQDRVEAWQARRQALKEAKRAERRELARLKAEERAARKAERARKKHAQQPVIADPAPAAPRVMGPSHIEESPGEPSEIPIKTLEELQADGHFTAIDDQVPVPQAAPGAYHPTSAGDAPWDEPSASVPWPYPEDEEEEKAPTVYHLPPTPLLAEPPERYPFVQEELKEVAANIKGKLEEFKITGSVVQINPGPVVTTYEYKPDAGIKYSRVTTLSDDLCLGLKAESVLIERIPGKQTIGLEVPNSRREIISLRQILESDEFRNSPSPLTICLGKDIAGRIKVSALDAMPHLLIAGSTGAGKSVMLNSLIMSLLYKSTPTEVRLILIDPKRLEMGLYEGVPHLLTPVITDARQATNALRNAIVEMEQRLRLLASRGVRNIDQFNRKVAERQSRQPQLFDTDEEWQPLPYIVIIIDEFADLMMLERASAEGSVTRLAQMARAVGIHLVVATQRPSVDVITGLIKANFPARISFRVATRVDSRTILDRMGAEHLLGKGDMLFLPPGTSRLVRVHGAFVTESEIERVVDFWKIQAKPDYDESFLAPPPGEDTEGTGEDHAGEPEDPMYRQAVQVILEAGKASTSILQRRLKLGYGRAARILDMMQKDGIIGPPDGSRPREVLKRPDWLDEVEDWNR